MKKCCNCTKDKFKKFFDINHLPGAIFLMIVTVVVTAIVQNLFLLYQNNIQYERDIREQQTQIISDLVEETTQIESLRDKIYWNKFWCQFDLFVESDKNNLENKNSIVDNYEKLENDYRTEYEKVVASYEATLLKSQMYFNVSDSMINEIEVSLSQGFNYDSDYIAKCYYDLLNEYTDANSLIEQLKTIAAEQYNQDFYDKSYLFAIELKNQIE